MSEDRTIRVCLVEAQRIFERALCRALEADGDIRVVRSAPTAGELPPGGAPHVVLVDLDDQPFRSAAIERLVARRFPGAALCAIATRPTLDLLRCRDAGRTTLVLKHRTAGELRAAVRSAARGTCTHDDNLTARLAVAG